MSDSSRVAVRKGRQVTKGTPATDGKVLRRSNGGGKPTSSREKSDEVRADLKRTGSRQTEFGVEYNIESNLTFKSHIEEWEEVLKATRTSATVINGAAGDITFTAITNVLSTTTTGKLNSIPLGFPIFIPPVSGINAANSGWILPLSRTGDSIVCGWKDFVTQTPTGSTVSIEIVSRVVEDVVTDRWVTIEEEFGDLATNKYARHTDCKASKGSMDIKFPGILKESFMYSGLSRKAKGLISAFTGTVVDADANPLMDGAHNVSNIIYGGELAPFDYTEIKFDINSGTRPTGKLGGGSKKQKIGTNTFDMSGTFVCYNDENCADLEDDHENDITRDFGFLLTDDLGNQLFVFAPYAAVASCERPPQGLDTDINCTVGFEFNMHPTYKYMFGLFFRPAP
jgi:hypothetical protein